jgi:response regulator of citrate/malate metabolism
LAKVRKKIFDLVLLDLSLPDTRPQTLILKLKEFQPEIGIVTMTASNSKELENEIRTLGIIYYMSKPVDEEALKEILDHSSRKKQKKLARK